MNSNLWHNILNVAIAVGAGLEAAALSTGCKVVDGAYDCSGSFLPPALVPSIVAGLAAIKIVINIARDGFGGLIKQQPPVK